jgi:hypothetical protein
LVVVVGKEVVIEGGFVILDAYPVSLAVVVNKCVLCHELQREVAMPPMARICVIGHDENRHGPTRLAIGISSVAAQ